VRVDTVVGPEHAPGSTYEIPLSPGKGFEVPAGERFLQCRITNNTNSSEERVECIVGDGRYYPGTEPTTVATESLLHYAHSVRFQTTTLDGKGIALANHADSGVNAFVTLVSVTESEKTLYNSDPADRLGLFAGLNQSSAGSTSDTDLLTVQDLDGNDVVHSPVSSGGSPFVGIHAPPLDFRFNDAADRAKAEMFAVAYSNFVDPERYFLFQFGQNHPEGQHSLSQYDPERPILLPPGYTCVARAMAGVTPSRRRVVTASFEWYEVEV